MISLGGMVWKNEWLSQPSEAGGFLPNWQDLKWVPSTPTPTPVLPHHTPLEQEGDILFIPKTLQAPLGCIFLANYLLFSWGFVDFVFSTHQNCKVSPLLDYNSAINSVCFILSLALHSAMIGTEAKAIKRFFWTQILFSLPHYAACGTSLTRGQTLAPCSRSAESYPLDHQGSPRTQILYCKAINVELHLCQTNAVHWILNVPNGPPFVSEALEFELMDCWSFLEFTPGASIDPSGLVISALLKQSQGRHFPLWVAALDFMPWPCRCFRNFSWKSWWSCAPCES